MFYSSFQFVVYLNTLILRLRSCFKKNQVGIVFFRNASYVLDNEMLIDFFELKVHPWSSPRGTTQYNPGSAWLFKVILVTKPLT